MSRYYYSSNDFGCGTILGYIAIFIVLMFIMSCSNGVHISNERDESNMIYIQEGYCYDKNTKIIYRETIIDNYRYGLDTPTYSPYINENGNYCKYKNGKWVEFIK